MPHLEATHTSGLPRSGVDRVGQRDRTQQVPDDLKGEEPCLLHPSRDQHVGRLVANHPHTLEVGGQRVAQRANPRHVHIVGLPLPQSQDGALHHLGGRGRGRMVYTQIARRTPYRRQDGGLEKGVLQMALDERMLGLRIEHLLRYPLSAGHSFGFYHSCSAHGFGQARRSPNRAIGPSLQAQFLQRLGGAIEVGEIHARVGR